MISALKEITSHPGILVIPRPIYDSIRAYARDSDVPEPETVVIVRQTATGCNDRIERPTVEAVSLF